jgi:hypothetical protein
MEKIQNKFSIFCEGRNKKLDNYLITSNVDKLQIQSNLPWVKHSIAGICLLETIRYLVVDAIRAMEIKTAGAPGQIKAMVIS